MSLFCVFIFFLKSNIRIPLNDIAVRINAFSSFHLFSKYLFWDIDPAELSMDRNAPYIIQRVLEYGQMADWQLINKYYGLSRIVSECKQMRSLDPVCLSFICNISHTNEEDYRCYHFRQYNPTLWNS